MTSTTPPVQPAVHRQARQAETRHVMASQPTTYGLWRTAIFNRSGAQAVEAENRLAVGIVNRQECFRAATIVTLPGVTPQKFVERFFTAVERLPVVSPADRLFCHTVAIIAAVAT